MTAWPTVALQEVMELSHDEHRVTADSSYRNIGIYSFGRGLFEKPPIEGASTSARTLFRVRARQFIYSRLFAFEGAYGLLPDEYDGYFVSSEFPSFEIDEKRLLPEFLALHFKLLSTWKILAERTVGMGDRRQRIKPEQVLAYEIPLPPLAEQRRIVAKIERLAAKIDEAWDLKNFAANECDFFWKTLSRMARQMQYPVRSLTEIVDFLDGQRIPLSKSERVSRQGSYPYYGASGIIDYIDDFIFDESLLLLSEDGANLLNRSTPIAFVATGKYWVNNHAHVLRPKKGVADLHFLSHALADFDVTDLNFASAQAKLNQKNAKQITLPLPPLDQQRRIVAYLDGLQAKVERLKALQAQTRAELDALLPAILDRAFKGEL